MHRATGIIVAVTMMMILCLCGFVAPTALGEDEVDQASAAKFVHAATRYVTVAMRQERAQAAAMKEVATTVREKCPHELPMALRNGRDAGQRTYEALFNEAGIELVLAGFVPIQPAISRFLSDIARLTWSDRRLARRVAMAVQETRSLLTLGPPEICREIAVAARSRFSRVPSATSRSLEAAEKHGDTEGALAITSLLAPMRPYLGEDRSAARHLRILYGRYQRSRDKITIRVFVRLLDAL